MGWNAGVDVSSGDLITDTMWNKYNGVSGSLEHLQDVACQIWTPVTAVRTGAAVGDLKTYGSWPVAELTNADDKANMSFFVPAEYTSLVSMTILVISKVTDAAANWDLSAQYGAIGQDYDQHTENDTATTYNVTTDKLYGVDASGVFTSLAANDYASLQLLLADAGDDVYVIGCLFKYTTA